MFVKSIQSFLKKQNKSCSRKDLANKCNISYAVLNNLLNATRPNPAFNTICNIADSFNISIDFLIGRSVAKPNIVFKKQEISLVMQQLKSYIKKRIKQENTTSLKLAQAIGAGDGAISEFTKEQKRKDSLGTAIILKLANHWDVSIDEMIGRTSPSKENLTTNQ